jgi:hypothetical protein
MSGDEKGRALQRAPLVRLCLHFVFTATRTPFYSNPQSKPSTRTPTSVHPPTARPAFSDGLRHPRGHRHLRRHDRLRRRMYVHHLRFHNSVRANRRWVRHDSRRLTSAARSAVSYPAADANTLRRHRNPAHRSRHTDSSAALATHSEQSGSSSCRRRAQPKHRLHPLAPNRCAKAA